MTDRLRCGIIMPGEDYRDLRQPSIRYSIEFLRPKYNKQGRCFVYGWVREQVYLYIGHSSIGRHRFYSHHIFEKYKPKSNDRIDVWFCDDKEEAAELEKDLIRDLTPVLNKTNNYIFLNGIYQIKKEITKPKRKENKIIIPMVQLYHSIPIEELGACKNKMEYNAVLNKYKAARIVAK